MCAFWRGKVFHLVQSNDRRCPMSTTKPPTNTAFVACFRTSTLPTMMSYMPLLLQHYIFHNNPCILIKSWMTSKYVIHSIYAKRKNIKTICSSAMYIEVAWFRANSICVKRGFCKQTNLENLRIFADGQEVQVAQVPEVRVLWYCSAGCLAKGKGTGLLHKEN